MDVWADSCRICSHTADDPYVNERANEQCIDPCHDAHYVALQLEADRRAEYGPVPVFTAADMLVMMDAVEESSWDMRSGGAEVFA